MARRWVFETMSPEAVLYSLKERNSQFYCLSSSLTLFSDILIISFYSYVFPVEAIHTLLGLSKHKASLFTSNLSSYNLSLFEELTRMPIKKILVPFQVETEFQESPCEKENMHFSFPFLWICPLSGVYILQ